MEHFMSNYLPENANRHLYCFASNRTMTKIKSNITIYTQPSHETLNIKFHVPFNWVDGERLWFDEPSKQEGVISSVELTVHDVSEVHIGPKHDLVFPVYRQT